MVDVCVIKWESAVDSYFSHNGCMDGNQGSGEFH